jgi:hypothetical protein
MQTNNEFTLSIANDQLWEVDRLIEFLVNNQGKDIVLTVNPEAHSLESSGVYDILSKFKFSSVTIHTLNQVEQHPTYNIIYGPVDVFMMDFSKYNLDSTGIWNQKKIFGAFYGRPTANRIAIAAYLFSTYPDQSLVKLVTNFINPNDRKLFELTKSFYYDPLSVLRFSKMIESFEFGGESYKPTGHNLEYQPKWFKWYEDVLIDIISEPNILGNTFYPTEKLVRCILMKKPFIAMTSKNYLDYLHQMGFYTFNEFWDESYDGFEAADRYMRILKLVDSLANMTQSELIDLYQSMTFQLEHNFNLIAHQLYKKDIHLIK